MKKARKLVSLLAALVIALSCLPMTAFAADETYTIKIYSGNAPQNNYGELQALDFIYTGCLAFKNYCESNSSGRIKVEIYPSGQLGLKTLASADNGGFRNFSNDKKPVHSASDMAGLKIRTMESPIYTKMLESFGASATPMAYSELYSALQTGVVDGQENSPGTTFNGSFYEVNKYYILDGHAISSIFLYMNSSFFNKLPADLQKIVTEAGTTATYAMRGTNCANEALALEALSKNGMEVYSPTAEEKESFKSCQEPVIQWMKEQIGDDTVDKFMAAVDAVKAGEATEADANTTNAASSSMNTVTYIAIGVAVVAVLVAVFTITRNKKKDEGEEA